VFLLPLPACLPVCVLFIFCPIYIYCSYLFFSMYQTCTVPWMYISSDSFLL
jgi:hypothetical protein